MLKATYLFALLVAGALLAPLAWSQPHIAEDGIVNAASYTPRGLPNSGIARGSMFVIFGEGLGPESLVKVSSFPLPETLAGTSIQVTVGGTTVDCIMIYTSALQVAAILPSRTPAGEGTLVLSYNGQKSNAVTIQVVERSFGIFTWNEQGNGPGIIQNFVNEALTPVNSLAESAQPDQALIIWGTGLGPVAGDEAAGPLPGTHDVDVEILLGNHRIKPLDRTRSGCCAAIDQISFVVPRGLAGCFVPLAVRVGGVISNFVTIAIDPKGGVCSDPLSFSADELSKYLDGESYSMGTVFLTRTNMRMPMGMMGPVQTDTTTDTAFASFVRYAGREIFQDPTFPPAPGSCVVSTFTEKAEQKHIRVGEHVNVGHLLDAGPKLQLNGPKGAREMPRITRGAYSALLGGGPTVGDGPTLEEYLEPGQYTVHNGDGGSDVGPFNASLKLPVLLEWTNRDKVEVVPRNQDLLITWSGGDPDQEYVIIAGTSNGDFHWKSGASFFCTAQVQAGQFLVPADVLSALPASGDSGGFPLGTLRVGGASYWKANKFSAPGLDAGYFWYASSSAKNVTYQ